MASTHTTIAFITRKFPPVKGGMEKYSQDLYTSLQNDGHNVTLVANTKGNKNIPFFGLRVLWFLALNNRSYTHIHLGDGSLALFAYLFKWWSSAQWSVTVHGLDITYPNFLYQLVTPKALNLMDKIVSVSSETKRQCELRRINQEITVIPNGIHVQNVEVANLDQDKIITLFSIGRLVKRKGIQEFVETVIPTLPPNYQYIIAGSGPRFQEVQAAIEKNNLQNRVDLLGRISDEEKEEYWKKAHVFMMPNIHVSGDMEGFGITLIEASSHGVPVVARAIEGITDAVIDGKTGILVKDPSVSQYQEAIHRALDMNRKSVSEYTEEHYSWDNLIKRYSSEIFVNSSTN